MFSAADQELEWVRSRVAARFPVYETKVTEQAVQFLVNVEPATMEAKFDDLRTELVPKDYIPVLARHGGEYSILVQRRSPQRFVGIHVNVILLVATLITTTIAGALSWSGYDEVEFVSLEAFGKGSVFFTIPLLLILGIHEMAHYLMAKRYNVKASLPFFLPAPPIPLGTFGAMISMRDPMPSRRALIDIGAAGPLFGLLTAIPITLAGLWLMAADPRPVPPNPGGQFGIELPILYQALALFVPIPQDAVLHPTAFAGWVGLFVTALNLLPAGQLDGGHVARAVLGENQRYLSYGTTLFMLFLGIVVNSSWLIIAIFILVLGARHPPPLNDLTPLEPKRYALGAITASVLVLSFAASPFVQIPPVAQVEFEQIGAEGIPIRSVDLNITIASNDTYAFRAVNAGNVSTAVNLTLYTPNFPPGNLTVTFESVTIGSRVVTPLNDSVLFTFNSTEVAIVTLTIDATSYVLPPQDWTFSVRADVRGDLVPPETAELAFTLHVA